ncbi:MAG TPA: M66 family metalloprotease [Polyangiaceae bacterium]
MSRIFACSVLSFAALASALACGGGAEPTDRVDTAAAGHAPCTSCVPEGGASGLPEIEAGAAGAAGMPDAANGIALSEVSFWQTVRVPLELNAAAVPGNAPLIQNKDSILRVYVQPDERFRARQLAVSVELATSGVSRQLESQKLIRAASQQGDFESTFNFPIDAGDLLADSSYSVTLRDGQGGPVLDRYPASERSALGAESAGNSLQIVVVPLVIGGVAPDVSAEKLAIFRARVLSMYPLADISLSARAPITSALSVSSNTGWDDLLDALYAQRAADAPADNVFYYGMLTPTATFDGYCSSDCTVGLSVVTDAGDVEERGSVGLGIFSDGSNSDAPDTMAHELGHALGRDHAPCDVSLKDSGPFPYKGGKIGVWGFDSLNHLLLDPQVYGDVMGYCSPDWISDFTYRGLFLRIKQVNAEVSGTSAKSLLPRASAYRRVLLRANGALAWGSRVVRGHAPGGPSRALRLVRADGEVLATVAAAYRGFGDGPGGFLLLSEDALRAHAGATKIRVGSAELALPSH